MGSYVLRGITTALLVTVLTLFGGIVWSSMDLGGVSISQLLDIGLLASCLIGGYRTAKESGLWLMGGVTGAGYVTVGTLLLALFLPIQGWGFIQVLAEGVLIGLIAGAFGAGTKPSAKSPRNSSQSQTHFRPSYAGYATNESVNREFDWNPAVVSKDVFTEKQGSPKDANYEEAIEWPWDREDKQAKLESQHKENFGRSDSWETESVESTLGNWEIDSEDRASMKKTNVNKISRGNVSPEKNRNDRPWWES